VYGGLGFFYTRTLASWASIHSVSRWTTATGHGHGPGHGHGHANAAPVANDDTATTRSVLPRSRGKVQSGGQRQRSRWRPSGLRSFAVACQRHGHRRAIGSARYTPNAGFVGTDFFEYQVTDGNSLDTATVTITVNPNQNPSRPTTRPRSGCGHRPFRFQCSPTTPTQTAIRSLTVTW